MRALCDSRCTCLPLIPPPAQRGLRHVPPGLAHARPCPWRHPAKMAAGSMGHCLERTQKFAPWALLSAHTGPRGLGYPPCSTFGVVCIPFHALEARRGKGEIWKWLLVCIVRTTHRSVCQAPLFLGSGPPQIDFRVQCASKHRASQLGLRPGTDAAATAAAEENPALGNHRTERTQSSPSIQGSWA